MKKNQTKFRLLLGCSLALIFGLATFVSVAASPPQQEDNPPLAEMDFTCQQCHPSLYSAWQNSAHGQALVDPIFQQEWTKQGEPRECLLCHTTGYDPETNTWIEDGITCQACHSPIEENHPTNPMPTENSGALCEQCHSQTVIEWQLSVHRKSGLDCVDCHGQHSTTLKAEDSADLCASCHRERASNFAHSMHSQQNLTCPDCHLETVSGDPIGIQGHTGKDHSFRPKLDACNECHSYQMHDPVDVHGESDSEVIVPELDAEVQTQGVSLDPNPVNPITFALISALIGMVGGLLLAPWIQEWYHKFDFAIQPDQDDTTGED